MNVLLCIQIKSAQTFLYTDFDTCFPEVPISYLDRTLLLANTYTAFLYEIIDKVGSYFYCTYLKNNDSLLFPLFF